MKIKFVKRNKNAITPTRAHQTDIGLDLTAIRKHKVILNGKEDGTGVVVMYDTGISITPPDGYYTEIVPRSSISKTGWMLVNSVGIIDPSYNGNLYIALIRVAEGVPEIKVPFCKCQLILRRSFYPIMVEVDSIEDSERGCGGFGSTSSKT